MYTTKPGGSWFYGKGACRHYYLARQVNKAKQGRPRGPDNKRRKKEGSQVFTKPGARVPRKSDLREKKVEHQGEPPKELPGVGIDIKRKVSLFLIERIRR